MTPYASGPSEGSIGVLAANSGLSIRTCMQGNDIREDRVMTFCEVRDEVGRLVGLSPFGYLTPFAFAQCVEGDLQACLLPVS
jgi:hypothetical protein